jgi:hypothetical protein
MHSIYAPPPVTLIAVSERDGAGLDKIPAEPHGSYSPLENMILETPATMAQGLK